MGGAAPDLTELADGAQMPAVTREQGTSPDLSSSRREWQDVLAAARTGTRRRKGVLAR